MMIPEHDLIFWAERYLKDELTTEEKESLNEQLEENEAFSVSWGEALTFLNLLEKKTEHERIKAKIKTVASEFKRESRSKVLLPGVSENKKEIPFLFRKYAFKLAGIAAALILVSTLITFFITKEKNPNTKGQYTLLRREIENIKNSQSIIMDSLQQQSTTYSDKTLYGGTGFALSNNGYVATNYHVVKDAHEIFVETYNDKVYKAYVVAYEPNSDVAILKIEDSDFYFSKSPLPYHFSKGISNLGQKVFTLGYPQDNLVYNEGYISCEHGFDNDSTSYQLEMVANPGQSGAPVLDKSGNVIALVTGKQSNTTGTTFAIHTEALFQLINSLPEKNQRDFKLQTGSNSMKNLPRIAQVKKIRPFICSIKSN